jgi:arginase
MSRHDKFTKSANQSERGGASRVARRSSTASVESFAGLTIRILGVPLDLGQSRRGVDMGPSAVRVAGLQARLEALGHRVQDGGNIAVEIAETQSMGEHDAKYLHAITETCTREAEQVIAALAAGETPLVLGGDHSIAVGTVSGVAEFHRRKKEKVGLIWIDAHADINTPQTSPSGNVHGMPVAALTGLGPHELKDIFGWSPKVASENVVLVGLRDIDATEKANIRRAGITEVYTMRDIDERGLRTVMEEAVRAAGRDTAGYHISLDMDWIDPEDAPGVGTPVRGGATYREAHLAMEIIADDGRMLSFELVEVNPVIDEHNRTADLAVELTCSAFGKKIL